MYMINLTPHSATYNNYIEISEIVCLSQFKITVKPTKSSDLALLTLFAAGKLL